MVLREMHITFDNSLKCQGCCLLDGWLLPISREKTVYSITTVSPACQFRCLCLISPEESWKNMSLETAVKT